LTKWYNKKMGIEKKSSRVPKASIVRGAPVVITTDDEFISFYDPLQFIVKDGGDVKYVKFAPGSPFSSSAGSSSSSSTSLTRGGSTSSADTGTTTFEDPGTTTINSSLTTKSEIVAIELPDVPNLTDIELFSSSKYYDPVTKVEKAKIVIKITNTSKDKVNIEGEDARIYNPSEKL
jgi:hypothetical protein